MPGLRIVPYRPDDRGALTGFVAAIQEHERTAVPALRPAEEVAAEHAIYILHMVRRHEGVVLLAWDGDAPVGFVAGWPAEDGDKALRPEARPHGYISDICVAESHRRRGVGRRLLAAFGAEMAGRGCRQLRICSKATNPAALAAYEASGFRPYEVILWKWLDDG